MFPHIKLFYVQYVKQMHVENSKENVEQALLKFRYDIQVYRYYGKKVTENEIVLIPKATELMGTNSYMPNVKCSLTNKEDGTDITLSFELRKGVETRMLILYGIVFLLMIIVLAVKEPVGIIPLTIIAVGELVWDRRFSFQRVHSLAKPIIKKITEVLEDSKKEETPSCLSEHNN